MMDKAIEMQNAKNKFQELKNEEIRLQSTQIKGEILELKSPLNEDEQIDEKLKSEVENDPLFKLFDDIFNPNKNKEIIDEIMKDKRFPSGGILVGIGKKRPNGEKDDCDCPACVLRRTLEGKERGFND
jgi:hypothetical protein